MGVPTREPREKRELSEEEPSKEPPRSSPPPETTPLQIGQGRMYGNAAIPSEITTDEVPGSGPRNPNNIKASFAPIRMDVNGLEKGRRAVSPVL